MKVVVARHCETDWNAQGKVHGATDIKLNDRGREQAKILARDVHDLGISIVVTSHLKRAAETGRIISTALGVPLIIDTRLRECAFGKLEGLSHAEFILRSRPADLPVWPNVLSADFTAVGGDRGQDVFDRQVQLLDELVVTHGDKTIMVIGHGRSLRTLLIPLGHSIRFLKQGQFYVISYEPRT